MEWQHHAVGMFFRSRDWETSQDRGNDERSKVQRDQVLEQVLRLVRRFTFQQDNDPKHTVKTSNLTELERICREEWEKLPKYRCAKLVVSYQRRLKAVITVKGASTKY